MDFKVTVTVENADTGRTTRQIFGQSPIWIGGDPASDVYLDAIGIGPQRGGIFFGLGVLEYWDLAFDGQTRFDGVPVPPRTAVPLSAPGLLTIGPYRLTVTMERPIEVEAAHRGGRAPFDLGGRGSTLGSRLRVNLATMRLESLATRAFDLAMALATIVVETRDNLVFPSPAALDDLAGIDEIVDHLLGSGSPDVYLDELARFVVAVVRCTEPSISTPTVARA